MKVIIIILQTPSEYNKITVLKKVLEWVELQI